LKSVLFFTLGIIFCFQSAAEQSTSGYWAGIMPNYAFDRQHSISLQAEARRQGDSSFVLVRPSYHYQWKKWVNFGLGADLFTTDKTELRHWVEFNLREGTHFLWSQTLHLRFRQEFRNLEDVESSGLRSRLMVMSQFMLSSKQGLELFVFDEVFYTQRSFQGAENFYDRNWLGFRLRRGFGDSFIDFGGAILSYGQSFD